MQIELTRVDGEKEILHVSPDADLNQLAHQVVHRQAAFVSGWAEVEVVRGTKWVNLDHVVAVWVTDLVEE